MPNTRVTLETARLMMDACLNKAQEMNLRIIVAVADDHGDLIAFNKMDGSLLISTEIAINKAWTSVAIKMTSNQFGQLANNNGPLAWVTGTNGHRLIAVAGGLPLIAGGEIIGGIGVSRATAEQDEIIAQAGVDVFQQLNA